MTTLVLVSKKIFAPSFSLNFKKIEERFMVLNFSGILTKIFLGLAAAFLAAYLVALYWTFSLGFGADAGAVQLKKLSGINLKLELQLQKARTDLAKTHSDVLNSMEKISSIKYLSPTDFTASVSYGKEQ